MSVASAADARRIREEFGQRVAMFAVHISGRSKEDAETFFDTCDIVTACASSAVRTRAKERALLQVGNKVPIYRRLTMGGDAPQVPAWSDKTSQRHLARGPAPAADLAVVQTQVAPSPQEDHLYPLFSQLADEDAVVGDHVGIEASRPAR